MTNPHHDARGRFASSGGSGRRAPGAKSPAQRHADGGLKPGWNIVQDKENRVVMYDQNNKDPWYQKFGIGYMAWNKQGQITWVQTQDDYLRQGVASALLNHVRATIRPDIQHSTELSDSGAAFAEADKRKQSKSRKK